MKIFDIHTHTFPDSVAESALSYISGISGIIPSYDGTNEGLKRSLQKAGYTCTQNCPIATKPSQVDSINSFAASHNKFPVFSLGTIHPDTENKEDILTEIKKNGLKGIKLHPEYQQFSPTDERMLPVWQFCSDKNLIVLTHSGKDAGFDEAPLGTPEEFAKIADMFPKLKLVIAHFGGWEMWDEAAEHLIGKNIYLDTSFTLGLLENAKFAEMAKSHGTGKILYGTDAPWRDQTDYLKLFLNLGFSEKDQNKILWKNAAELLGI